MSMKTMGLRDTVSRYIIFIRRGMSKNTSNTRGTKLIKASKRPHDGFSHAKPNMSQTLHGAGGCVHVNFLSRRVDRSYSYPHIYALTKCPI